MEHVVIPDAVQSFPKLSAKNVYFVLYSQKANFLRNRVIFNCNAVSFVLSGRKEIFHTSHRTTVSAGEVTLIPQGNSLIAERSFDDTNYISLVGFFPTSFAVDFIKRRNIPPSPVAAPGGQLKFQQTMYIKDYVGSICTHITNGITVSENLVLHKMEELLLILMENQHEQFMNLFQKGLEQNGSLLKNIVENNLMQNLTLEELAFLAHKSLSSFKRDFEKAYNISPGKYIRERKLELALIELSQGKSPSQLYLDYGYESLSNFIHAFKKKFGYTPGEYLQQGIAV